MLVIIAFIIIICKGYFVIRDRCIIKCYIFKVNQPVFGFVIILCIQANLHIGHWLPTNIFLSYFAVTSCVINDVHCSFVGSSAFIDFKLLQKLFKLALIYLPGLGIAKILYDLLDQDCFRLPSTVLHRRLQ